MESGAQLMKRQNLTAAAIAVGAACVMIVDVSTPSAQLCAAEPQSFSEDILPILTGRCVSCQQPGGAGYEKSGLDLTTYEGLMKGTKFGAMVIPRDPESSNLMWLLDWRAPLRCVCRTARRSYRSATEMPFARGSVRAPKTIEIAAVRSIAMLPVAQLIGEGRVMLSAATARPTPWRKNARVQRRLPTAAARA